MSDHEDATGAAGSGTATTAPEPVTVVIVDDHRSFAELLRRALEMAGGFRCVGLATTADEGVACVRELQPAVVVMDIQMPGTDGLAATRSLRAACPHTAVAVVTALGTGEWMARAARAGASAFIPKDTPLAELVAMLREARPGRMQVAPSLLQIGATGDGRAHGLTPRQVEVLACISRGLDATSTARVMGISVGTCRGYIKAVYATLQVSSRIAAVNRARELHLIGS
ncbi:DNA-binding response regulator, NarL/FixJ family, contains REC and HTH domains [Friedmanniella luteola]|uniref:DNA-binding response regulator, NarL/FixJ family, contains REC and HTH domains n=1 Tax=Friedmanniella luteola TaxID=546871 RepID=A0A1H1TF91_9ACTN|nr:response regulator transcription factor [Friedmanniella luteola]SDS58952.1 DNA-binding response regulator, NarL/FixJ family, contains REC and HTH domains [Friedmanniella luteola]